MKKFFSAIFIVISLNCFAQANKWFVSFTAAPSLGGPAASLKHQMKAQGYGDQSESSFVIFGSGTTKYPRGGAVALLASGGKKIADRRSIYFVAGLSEKATIEGFDEQGYSNGLFGLFAGSYGRHTSVSYTTYQFTAGYMYSFPNSRTKLGFGPSVYLLRYGISENFSPKEKHSSIVPGVAFNTRIPFGKQRKLIGLELVFNGNMAPPVKMKSGSKEGFQPKNANMFSFNAGLALTVHNKPSK
jgi:hypothetical protein